jgi:hypothetical protein
MTSDGVTKATLQIDRFPIENDFRCSDTLRRTLMRGVLACTLLGYSAIALAQGPSLNLYGFEESDAPIATTSHHRVIATGGATARLATPGVTIAPNGDWLVIYNRTTPGGPTYHTLRRSLDRGLHWGPEILQWNASTPDPTLWKTPQRRLLVEFGKLNSASVAGAAWSISFDSGYTWGSFSWFDSPVDATTYVTNYLNVGDDIYGIGYQPSSLGDGTTDACLWLSEDDATSWGEVSTLRQPGDASINETAISRMGKKSLFAISRGGDGAHTYAHISKDMGQSWSSQLDYTSQVGVIDDPNLLKIGDVLVLVGRNTSASQLIAYFSRDQGRTFRSPLVLDAYDSWHDGIAYSAMVPLHKNSALIVYSTHHGDSEIDSLELHVNARSRRLPSSSDKD